MGQRKSRKDQQSNEISRGSSIRSSESSGSRASKASSHSKPSLLGFFSTNKKAPLARSGSQTRGSALSPDQKTKASRRISSYVPSEPSSSQKSPTTRVPENEDFKQGNLYNAETDVSSPSDGRHFFFDLSHCFNMSRICFVRQRKTISQYRLFMECHH